MIKQEEVISIGRMGRQGWRRIVEEVGDEPFFVLDIDGILVPWRTETFDLSQAEKYAGCEAYRIKGLKGSSSSNGSNSENEDLTWEDLIGYMVEGYGRIADVDESTANTLLILEDGRLLPGHEDLILSLDTEGRTIVMNLPEGL